MPKLWIFNHYAGYPETVPATRTYELAVQLTRRGWDVTVIACSFNHYTFVDDFPDEPAPIYVDHRDGVRWVFIKGASYQGNGQQRFRNMIGYALSARRWARGQAERPNVVIGTTVHPFAAEAARRIAKANGVPFLYEITDLWPESLVDLGHTTRKSPVYRALRFLERRAFGDADGVIGIPPGIPQYALDTYGISIDRFCYVPNGITLGAGVPPAVTPLRGSIAYAGGFAPAHGMPAIVRVAANLEAARPGHFTIHLYGDGPERATLESLISELGVTNVVCHGLVAKSSLQKHLRSSSMFLCTGSALPVHRYGISFNKLFDYFNAARPVVFAVDSGNNPVQEAGAGISVPAGDHRAIADAILTLDALPPSELEAMGARGQVFLRQEHSFDVLATRLDAFLADQVGASSTQKPTGTAS